MIAVHPHSTKPENYKINNEGNVMRRFDDDLYVPDMYDDSFYPNFLVDKVKVALKKVVDDLETDENYSIEEVLAKFNSAVIEINGLRSEFDKNNSELETVARDCIFVTVRNIIKHFDLDIDADDAMGQVLF